MSMCSLPCSGNSHEKCGGYGRVEAFELFKPVHLGCFNDKRNRVLKGRMMVLSNTNTPEVRAMRD